MFPRSRTLKLVPALALIGLAIPASASAQATRTWVSGVGDDVNPCSRTAPCKTFAGAISKTAAGGEINCLDPGGFGTVTITKSLAIKCHYTEGGIVAANFSGVIVNAQATDKITLRGLDINGVSTGAPSALAGVRILSAKVVNIFDTEIYRFRAGVQDVPTSVQTRVVVKNSHIHDNGIGFINAPGNNTIQFSSAVLLHNDFQDNACAVVTSSQGANGNPPDANASCGTSPSTSGISKIATTGIYNNSINFNGFGVFTRGASAEAEIGWDSITNNDSFGILRADGGTVRTFTPNTNVIFGNGASDAPNATTPLGKRHVRRVAPLVKPHAKRVRH